MKWVGIPVGVGIAPTRTLAKIANHIGKKSPEGVFVMPDNQASILSELPVVEVWGIGSRLSEKLNRLGIRTAEQLRLQDDAFLRQQFSVCVARTAIELNGIPALEMDSIEEPSQSISCSRSFGHPVIDLRDLSEAVAVYTSTAATKLRKENQKAAGANVYFQYYPEYGNVAQDGGITGTTVVFDIPTGDTSTMLNKIAAVLPGIIIEGRRYKKAGVIFFGLESVMPSLLPMMLRDNGASNQAIAFIVSSIYMVVNAVANPIISYKSDRFRSRWGRRRPFILMVPTVKNITQ